MAASRRRPGYTLTEGLNAAHAARIVDRLRASNYEGGRLPPNTAAPLEVYALDASGAVVGGLVGRTVWGWMEVVALWVEEGSRGRGLVTELMRRAEAEARRRGCSGARFSTWDFQAPGFYARLGYTPYGRLDGYPPGHTVYYLHKKLTEERDPAAPGATHSGSAGARPRRPARAGIDPPPPAV